jgi:hypothetical protein
VVVPSGATATRGVTINWAWAETSAYDADHVLVAAELTAGVANDNATTTAMARVNRTARM